ncbi:MAG: glycoside hydrolase family 3 N-terminal domain-containing protein, partial [Sterolibacterium sp.]
AHDAALVGEIGAAVGKAVRATGIHWVFAPTLAVVRDDRWGRTYESFSEDGALVNAYAGAYVRGMQGTFADPANVVATAKHFMGDGGTDQGVDQGVTKATKADMINIHGQGYYGALAAGAQTVMASFNSWNDVAAGVDYGKMHGSKALLTDMLKHKLGFDGFVVSDWNGIAQVPGCKDASCPQAINAGIDMVMVPDDWQAFIANTIAEVDSGKIPLARIDDAVTRILRVKLRAGLFDQKPSQSTHAGRQDALQARALARQAVQGSLVLLKNNGQALPLARGKKILVVGKSADSLPNQTGGWTLTWQGTENRNSDFPNGDTILAGIREASGSGNVVFSEKAGGVDVGAFDAVIAVIGETPYAEGAGDIPASDTLHHAGRYPEDLAVLKAVAGKGKPVITVFLSGRPLYVNDLLNLSDAFVAAWLPGSEGKGVADVLFRNADGVIAKDFRGSLSFSWPKSACQTPLNFGDANYAPLFPLGYGLKYAGTAPLGQLATDAGLPEGGCGGVLVLPVFNQSERPPYTLYVSSAANNWADVPVGADLNGTLNLPAANPSIRVQTTQVNIQQDAKLVTWFGAAQVYARSPQKTNLQAYANARGALQFDVMIHQLPQGTVRMAMDCGYPCRGVLDLTGVLKQIGSGVRRTVKIPLACFAAKGTDLARVDTPFNVSTTGQFSAAFTKIQLVAGAAGDFDALRCSDFDSMPK